MKAILIIGDGMGDRPLKELGRKTPLEAARTPNLDLLAAKGECGILDPIAPGIRAGSDTGHLALLGYDPYAVYTGRGPFEALGIGMDLQPGDVAFRCNFATVDDNFVVLDRRAGRIEKQTDELANSLNGLELDGVKCFFKESTAHRGALVLRGKDIGCAVSDPDPHRDGETVKESVPLDEKSGKTSQVLNAFVQQSYKKLKFHPVNLKRMEEHLPPANVVLPRGAGAAPHLQPFKEKHKLTCACIAEVGLLRGIGRYLGMDIVNVPEATGGLQTDTLAVGRKVLEMLPKYDFILCNIKGTDVAGHDGNVKAKVEMVEKIDRMMGLLMEKLPDDVYVAVTADHSTPCAFKDHSGDPVPLAVYGPEVRVDEVKEFNERAVARGSLGRIKGVDLMNILTSYLGTSEKFGA